MRILALVLFAAVAYGQQATCWPQASDLRNHFMYFCAVDAPPGSAITGRALMAALAELEPVPGYVVASAGGDQNRGGVRRRFERVEEYGLPLFAILTDDNSGVIKVKEAKWNVLIDLLPFIVPQVRRWIGAATPAEWTSPPTLAPESDIPLDSHGAASVTLYTRREGGVRRVSLPGAAPAPPTPASAPAPAPGFVPASWLALRQQARPSAAIATWRAVDESWRLEERIAEAEARMNFHEVELLAGR